ncbi:MAG: o-succinylbenzoate synthase [Prevotella sp.]|nr:o-succinylbenzoate synthase [Prevotella sp.]
MKISIVERVLHFRQPAGTSRGVYTERKIWLVSIADGDAVGVGECAPLPLLSCDDLPDYQTVLRRFCDNVEQTGVIDEESLRDYPSMLFGLETAMRSLHAQQASQNTLHSTRDSQPPLLFSTPFARGEQGIPINGLIWMGSYDEMHQRISQKLEQGFRCIKLKIGAIDFDAELDLLRELRQHYGPRQLQLRVDANGAFPFEEALYKLELLSQYALHSIEQPIKAGQWSNMAELCRESPLPIALDEELIGINDPGQKRQMLNIIRPSYIILKPSLHGGMAGCREWIEIARDMGIGTWITSALESNIGLNAIAQFCSDVYGNQLTLPQGLGTGQLFTDNIPMPLEIRGDQLWICRNS